MLTFYVVMLLFMCIDLWFINALRPIFLYCLSLFGLPGLAHSWSSSTFDRQLPIFSWCCILVKKKFLVIFSSQQFSIRNFFFIPKHLLFHWVPPCPAPSEIHCAFYFSLEANASLYMDGCVLVSGKIKLKCRYIRRSQYIHLRYLSRHLPVILPTE